MTAQQVEQRMSLLRPTLNLEELSNADLIIEAVFEELDIKRAVFRRLDQVAKKDAILASNTSFLSVDEIAAVTSRPAAVLGLHFFSPANVMRLLEVVRGRAGEKNGVRYGESATVYIADSVRDVQAAHIARSPIIAVATGSATVAELRGAGAEVVLSTLADTDAVVRAVLELTSS